MLHDASEVDSTCYVRCGGYISLAVERVGAVTFQIESDCTLLYVPTMRVSVLSALVLEDEGYTLHF